MDDKTLMQRYGRLLDGPSSFTANFFRFCMSDQISIPLFRVTEDLLSPIQYATEVEETDGGLIKQLFLKNSTIVRNRRVPIQIYRLWAYDRLVSAAVYFRIRQIFSEDDERQQRVFSVANMYLLNTVDDHYDVTSLGGLSHFGAYARTYMGQCPERFENKDKAALWKVINAVSEIDKADWLLWDTKWQQIFNSRYRANNLRRFLHTVLAAASMPEDNVMSCFDMLYSDIETLAFDFVELRNNSKAKKSDVTEFITRLGYYFDDPAHNPGMELLLEAPFRIANMFYNECQANPMLFHQQMMHDTSSF